MRGQARRGEIKEVVPLLRATGVNFSYLPPYSPELNAIAVLWRHRKYEELPARGYAAADLLKEANVVAPPRGTIRERWHAQAPLRAPRFLGRPSASR